MTRAAPNAAPNPRLIGGFRLAGWALINFAALLGLMLSAYGHFTQYTFSREPVRAALERGCRATAGCRSVTPTLYLHHGDWAVRLAATGAPTLDRDVLHRNARDELARASFPTLAQRVADPPTGRRAGG